MCGIAGLMQVTAADGTHLRGDVERMVTVLHHRGPDGRGIWYDPQRGVVLGHCRLAVVDLTEAGAQPMMSASGRFVLNFNGEIYNAPELRSLLDRDHGIAWRGHSDTEVLLEAIALWGLESALRRATGMFAFALWDREERVLFLARDRIGEKPLFYGWVGNSFLFASELKALYCHPNWRGEIDRNSLQEFLRFSYVNAPRSIYAGIHKLLPGTYAQLRYSDPPGTAARATAYWSVPPATGRVSGRSDESYVDHLEQLLTRSIQRQLVADVPVGAFLSGGIDSTIVVAIAQRLSSRPVRTFTIGFREGVFDESAHAARVAEHLGTEHHHAYVGPSDALDLIPRLPDLFDEPQADSSQIPTFFVSRLARQQVTVALSGDAGDELFCGYNHYVMADRLWRAIGRTPRIARSAAGAALRGVSHAMQGLPPKRALDRAYKLGLTIDADSDAALYERLVDNWHGLQPVIDARTLPWWRPEALRLLSSDRWLAMCVQDLLTYLPNAILTKVDRAAMSVSLETRIPFLDHAVVEYALSLPMHLKFSNGRGKVILRKLLQRYVPAQLTERPKSGFAVPIASWLRGPLRGWAEDLLSESSLRKHSFFAIPVLRRCWLEHVNDYRDWSAALWNVLMFQAWIARQSAW